METTVQLRKHGAMTLPKNLREKYDLREGDVFHILDLDGVMVLTPVTSRVMALAHEIEAHRRAAGWTTDALLEGLRQERERAYRTAHDQHEPH